MTVAACALFLLIQAGDPFPGAREQMVKEQIEARGIRDERLLSVLRKTPRHLFVPAELRPEAYEDHPLPIGYDATISQPFIVAWMTQLLQPAETHRVLEIGTGSGYQTAVLSRLAKSVYTIEIVPELARSAAKRLAELGYKNVAVREGNGYNGWAEQAPFDRIILTAAPDDIPKALLVQLAAGGRLVAPVGSGLPQKLTVVDKAHSGALQVRSVGDVQFVPMIP
ncbi:MAG TPA: protein-L-isoaspartate(D-aspartate) O-methyltransferase [Bryobacteraceae bacterium]|jgi:protein-L-isoaspartate(D-aspartate) O-methyltransferase